ncbi:MmpS family transport accessory protein [Paractinoplanes toevensis]|uniref:MmpS family transport accessory protein n=1 Tax=Paractinoplanes toevensis TaxID=571911 RepID=UPI001BB44256|nr:MmpS family transport accessory protein [Actinoplanes toevensis]
MTDQPNNQQPGSTPDPSAAPPPSPDGTSSPVSGQPWSTPSGDSWSPEPYRPPSAPQPPSYSPGYAPIPPPPGYEQTPGYPPTSQFPPVNYAPAGYAPDYGHPVPPDGYGGYPPPGYPPTGYPPPQPPPRRSSAPIIAVILAVALLLCGGIATAGLLIARGVKDKAAEAVGDLPTAVPELPGLPTDLPTDGPDGTGRQITFTYEVTGDGPASIIYVEKIGEAPKRLENVKLPWKFTGKAEIPALLSIVVVRIDTSEGSVSCRALVDGDEVKKNESGQSNFATANCTQLVLE